MDKRIALFLFLGLSILSGINGQTLYRRPPPVEENLVPNPSFENMRACPRFNESIRMVEGWERSHIFSADYFHRCASPTQRMSLGAPQNVFGYQEPRTGDAYAGLSFCNELLVAQLKRPLVKDSIYRVEFFVSLSDTSNVGTRYFGMYISTRPIRFVHDNWELISHFILDHEPQIKNPRDRYLIDKQNWTSISGLYTAKGGERHISIGGFHPYHDSLVRVLSPVRQLSRVYR